jgi:hypothetical protein
MPTLYAPAVTETDLAYLAGLIDGGGTIAIDKHPPVGHYKSPRYQLRVDIQTSERPIIDHVATLFERSIMIRKATGHMTKDGYRINWSAQIAARLLELLAPYLVLKRPQALVALDFQRITAARRTKRALTAEELEARDYCYRELRRLKCES